MIKFLFSYDYIWMSLGFTLIDKFSTSRNYIHDSGCAFLQVDKTNSITWKDNMAIADSSDTNSKEKVFQKTISTFIVLDILFDMILNNNQFGKDNELKLITYNSSMQIPTNNLFTRQDNEFRKESRQGKVLPEELASKLSCQ